MLRLTTLRVPTRSLTLSLNAGNKRPNILPNKKVSENPRKMALTDAQKMENYKKAFSTHDQNEIDSHFQNLTEEQKRDMLMMRYTERYGIYAKPAFYFFNIIAATHALWPILLMFALPLAYNFWVRKIEQDAIQHETVKNAIKYLENSEKVDQILGKFEYYSGIWAGYDVKIAYTQLKPILPDFILKLLPPYPFVLNRTFRDVTFQCSTKKTRQVYIRVVSSRENSESTNKFGEWKVDYIIFTFKFGKLSGKTFMVYNWESDERLEGKILEMNDQNGNLENLN